MESAGIDRALAFLFLERSRRMLRVRWGRSLAVAVGGVYALLALLFGNMLQFFPTRLPWSAQVVVPLNTNTWWNYPALLVTSPGGLLTLPFLATIAMVIVSVGVAIGMSVGILLTLRLRTASRRRAGGASVSSAAGFTPALIALVTLGACCSTTAAATAGIGAIAQASGTGTDQVLFNNWYLSLFQVGVLWVALLAQEQLIAVYGGIAEDGTVAAAPAAVAFDRRSAARASLRFGLLAAGVVWALSGFVAWTAFDPVNATAGLLAGLFVQHLALAAIAIVAGLFAAAGLRPLLLQGGALRIGAARLFLVLVGLSVAIGTPPPLAGAGVYGFVNELLGSLGAPAAWGAVAPPPVLPSVILLRWLFEFLLLGGFAVAVGLFPQRVAAWLERTGAPSDLRPSARVALAGATSPSVERPHQEPSAD